MNPSQTGRLVLGRQFQQPDQRSCGAAVAVLDEALRNDGYARRLLASGADGFAEEVAAMHRRITSAVDVSGSMQLPWPRLLGTAPWALARQVGRQSQSRQVMSARINRGRAWAAMVDSLRSGQPVPVYVGTVWLPRHVCLALAEAEDTIRLYEPASGRLAFATREQWVTGRLALAGWRVPWFVLIPRARRTPA